MYDVCGVCAYDVCGVLVCVSMICVMCVVCCSACAYDVCGACTHAPGPQGWIGIGIRGGACASGLPGLQEERRYVLEMEAE